MTQFKLNKITGALIAAGFVLPAGYAVAQVNNSPTISPTDRGPREAATMFVGSGGTAKLRITSTTTAAQATTGAHSVQLHCFVGSVSAGAAATVADSNVATAGQTFLFPTPFSSACGASAGNQIVLIYSTAATGTDGDFIGGTVNQFAVVTPTGALGAGAPATSSAAALAAANLASSLAVRAGYAGPIITTASQTGATGTVLLDFSANLSGDVSGTSAVGAAANVNVAALKVVDGQAVGTATFLIVNTASTDQLTVSTGTAATGFTSAANKVQVSSGGTSNIFDTAGNPTVGQTVYTAFSNTSGVAFNASGAQAIARGFSSLGTDAAKVDAWNPTLSQAGATGTFVITLRLNEAIDAISNTSTLSITAPLGVADLGQANGTDREITVTIPAAAGNEVGFSSTGQLLVTTNNWATSAPVTIGLSSTTTGTLMVAASDVAIGTSGVTAVAVMAGATTLPARGDLTLDSNVDGLLDGVTVRTNNLFNLTYGAVAPTLATAAGSSLSLLADNSTITFASTVLVNATPTTQVTVILNNLAGVNDWNADGATTGDAALFNLAGLGTGLTNPLFSMRLAGVNATTGASGLNTNAFRVFDGGAQALNNSEASSTVSTFVDNAPPVVVSVTYSSVSASGAVVHGLARDAYGDVLIVHSEGVEGPVNLGSLQFNFVPSTLVNLNANVPGQVESTIETGNDPFSTSGGTVTNGMVRLQFMPGTVATQSQALSFPTTLGLFPTGLASNINESGGTAAPDYLAVVNSVASRNQVATPLPTQATPTGAALHAGFVAGQKMPLVIITYTEPVKALGNLNGVFIVRARVGEGRKSIFQNRDTAAHGTAGTSNSQDAHYDFIVPASNIAFGTNGLGGTLNSLTITIPDAGGTSGGLPFDTTEVWVDYEPNGTSTNMVVRASDNAAVPNPDAARFATVGNVEVPVTAAPTSSVMFVDADTIKVTVPQQFLANVAAEQSGNLLTQTIGGKLEFSAGSPLPANVGIRADLIRVVTTGTKDTGQQDAVFLSNDGHVKIARGPNSETGTDQVVAAKNLALNLADMNAFYTALRNYNNALKNKAVDCDMDANKVYALLKAETEALRKYDIDVFGQCEPFESLNDGAIQNASIRAFVEITTGAGALASSGSNGANIDNAGSTDGVPYSQNANSEFGRTATIRKDLPNVQKNGTTYYPVRIFIGSTNPGLIEGIKNNSGENPLEDGRIPLRAGNPFPDASTEQCRFEVMDTAFTLGTSQGTAGTFYAVTVGSTEVAFANAGGPLDPSVKDGFVQISVRNPSTGNYVLLTSADASFAKHIKFVADLKSNGKMTKRDFALNAVATLDVNDVNGWQLLGLVGELDRTTTGPLDPRAWLSVRDDNGAPITNFSCDNTAKDEAFVLGTDATVANSVKVAFEGANNTLVNNLRPSKAAGIAFNANDTGKAAEDTDADGILDDHDADGWTPQGATAARTAPKLFLPIKPGVVGLPKLLKNSWHLVTVQTSHVAPSTPRTFATLPTNVDAAIIVKPSGAVAWFRGEDATKHLDNTTINQGTAIFLHVGPTDVTDGTAL